MIERVYRLAAWGDDAGPEVFRAMTEFARTIAGDGVRVEVVEVPLGPDDDEPEFERETFGHDGTWREP